MRTMRPITIYRVLAVLAFAAFCFLVFSLASCGATKTIVKEGEVRTEWRDRYTERRDSVYLHDSVYIHSKGDTVYLERWHTRIRDRTLRDTLYLHKTDSVYVETQVKKSSAIADINSTLRVLGCTAVILAVIIFILKILRRWR
nr:MAG TPA: hypothetical protein [Caudoviricetes sp.]